MSDLVLTRDDLAALEAQLAAYEAAQPRCMVSGCDRIAVITTFGGLSRCALCFAAPWWKRAERRVWCGGRPDDAPCPWCDDEEDAR